MDTWAVVLAAGSGTRFGGQKQFAMLGGTRLVDRVVETASTSCDAVVLVLPPDVPWDGTLVTATATGGASRAESVRSGLRLVPETARIIVIHDAAHPLASSELFSSVIRAIHSGADAAVPGLRLTETMKRVENGRVVETVTGPVLIAAQTPHAFRAEVLRAAHATGADAVDDTVLVEAIGASIVVIPGDPMNVHVTTPAELDLAARLLDAP